MQLTVTMIGKVLLGGQGLFLGESRPAVNLNFHSQLLFVVLLDYPFLLLLLGFEI